MKRLVSFIKGAGVGAGLMYFFDPRLGNRRRSLARDQLIGTANQLTEAADRTLRDVQNRATGVAAEFRACVSGAGSDADDEVLVSRVRSKLGRHVSHPSAIEVEAHDGCVTLSGPILNREVQALVRAIESVRGVEDVENQLDLHDSAESVSALQGGRQPAGEPPEWMQSNWSPTMRLAAGTALGFALLGRRLVPLALAGAAFTSLTRSWANPAPQQSSRKLDPQGRRIIPPRPTGAYPPEVQERREEGSPTNVARSEAQSFARQNHI